MFFKQRVIKPNVVHPYHGILVSNNLKKKKELIIDICITWMNLQIIMLGEKAKPKGIFPCTYHSFNDKITEMAARSMVAGERMCGYKGEQEES